MKLFNDSKIIFPEEQTEREIAKRSVSVVIDESNRGISDHVGYIMGFENVKKDYPKGFSGRN